MKVLHVCVSVAALSTLACGSGSGTRGFEVPPDAGDRSSSPSTPPVKTPKPSDEPTLSGAGSRDAGSPEGPSEVYGHSAGTLYKLDPVTKGVTVVGNFDGCDSVIDIALNKTSQLYATTTDGLYEIDRATARCTLIATGAYPNSLSFVPAGTLDPAAEALVGYEGATYVRMDTKTGSKRTVGMLGQGYSSSGDIVSVNGGNTYLTVIGDRCGDCLVEVNPATGALVKNWGSIGHANVFGLSFWAGSLYGFDSAGELFEVTLSPTGLTTAPIGIPQKPANLSFWGAGSTTSAPLVPR